MKSDMSSCSLSHPPYSSSVCVPPKIFLEKKSRYLNAFTGIKDPHDFF